MLDGDVKGSLTVDCEKGYATLTFAENGVHRIQIFFTPDEARAMAERLVDAALRIEATRAMAERIVDAALRTEESANGDESGT